MPSVFLRDIGNALLVAAGLIACGLSLDARGQEARSGSPIVGEEVSSQVAAFTYREGPESHLDFVGTPLASRAKGEVEVEYQNGRAAIDAEVEDMPEPWNIGPYTTYVLWAVTADGRALNLGELLVKRGKAELETAAALSQFALIVTAEPHYAVSAPSKAVVLQNVARKVKGSETVVRTLTDRADYASLARQTIDPKGKTPIDLYAARYSIAIAEAEQADQYAATELTKARETLAAAEAAQASKKSSERRTAPLLAREAIQAGEDAKRAAIDGRRMAQENAARAEAEAAQARASAAAAAASAEAARASAAESDVDRIRKELQRRMNEVLPTRETGRGLVAELSGVQFATGKATLNPRARETLARFSGVLASYPGLKLSVEGHTDSTGSLATNEKLSLERAITVRDYLIAQGVPASAMDVAGFGPSQPLADNETKEGRERNRRVEIIVASASIPTSDAARR
jgi:outer membrane protein OmpA-like peptidoglycan-associated protein